jgi:hypothetical protein
VPHWTVYVRAECGLCEQMLSQLGELLGVDSSNASVIDIDSDPALEARYGRRVPVLLADGEFVCAYQLDEGRVRSWMTSPP